MPTLSVWETLQFTTDLRLPESFTKADKEALMTEALHNMGLQKVKHSQVRGTIVLHQYQSSIVTPELCRSIACGTAKFCTFGLCIASLLHMHGA